MNNLYNKIYNAINEGVQKSLYIPDEQDNLPVNYSYNNLRNNIHLIDYEMVDLGLSVKWHDRNLGAKCKNTAESWYGDYYAWGELKPKSEYTIDNHCGIDNIRQIIKNDTESILHEDNDVISYNYHRSYRMPTQEEYVELMKNTNHDWVYDYDGIKGLNGLFLISKINQKQLFIPATGSIENKNKKHIGDECALWLSTYEYNAKRWNDETHSFDIKNLYPQILCVKPSDVFWSAINPYWIGLPVRAVCE